MYDSLSNRVREVSRTGFVLAALFLGQYCLATQSYAAGSKIYLSQAVRGVDVSNLMNVVVIVLVGLVLLLLLIWVVRRLMRRSQLASLRQARLDSPSDGKRVARSRPEKTEVVRSIVIGNAEDADVRFESESVSETHAELLVLRHTDSSPLMPLEPIFYLRDLEDTSGIEVFRRDAWQQFKAEVVLGDEQLRVGDVETTADEINRLAIQARVAATAPRASE